MKKKELNFETERVNIIFVEEYREIYLQFGYKKDYEEGKKKLRNAIKEIQKDEKDMHLLKGCIKEAKRTIRSANVKGTIPLKELRRAVKTVIEKRSSEKEAQPQRRRPLGK